VDGVLSGLFVLVTLAVVIASAVRGRDLGRRIEARPDGRVRFYRLSVLRGLPLLVLPAAIVGTSERVTARDVGWAWPHGVAGYLFTAYYLIFLIFAGVRARRLMRGGAVFAGRRRFVFMIPRTARERRWAVAVALTAGVVEETVFRGGLLAVGTKIYHLPSPAVMVVALVLFAAGHLYQGGKGFLGTALAGAVFTAIFAAGGGLLLAAVAHTAQDLTSLLLIPAEPTPKPAEPTPKPAEPTPKPAEPTPQPAEPTPQPAESTPQPAESTPRQAEAAPPQAEIEIVPAETSPIPRKTPGLTNTASPKPVETPFEQATQEEETAGKAEAAGA
jgi:membrane protease YdiL (CAAX protease family)